MTNSDQSWNTLVDDLVGAVRALPGVGEVTAVVRRDVRMVAPATHPPATMDVADAADGDRPPANLYGGPIDIPVDAPKTLQEALRIAADQAPEKGTIFITKGNPDSRHSHAELLADAQRVLCGLRANGLTPGDAALFVFDDNKLYLTAYWACVLGGFVPTPVAVATTYDSPNEVNRKLHNAWQLLNRPAVLTDAPTARALNGVRELWQEPDVRILMVEELLDNPPDTDWFPATPESPVLNMLTSGSTGVPKCVHHTNASVVARAYSYRQFSGLTSDDVTLTWMPFDHVTVPMFNVRDVIFHCMHVNAKTNHVLGDCLLLLDWVHKYRVTNTWAPNFAIAMLNERAAEIRDRAWELSCLREITNGGEPVVAGTSHRFLELLAPYGLRADAMTPAWGMSETCSGVTYSRQSRDDKSLGTVAIDPASLSRDVRHLDPSHRNAVVLSTVGRPIPGVQVRVADEAGRVLREDRMGELQVRGRTMMHSYFANPQAQRESWDAEGWFRTGDLAFVHDGELVIAGRIKDQIIVRGINYLAHELESVVERIDGVRVTFSAAAGVREPGEATDQLVIFFVPERWDPASLSGIASQVRAVLAREAGLAPDLVVPVTEAEFPKTNSGKIQRAALVKDLRAGMFDQRVIGRGTGERAADAWLVRRRWAEFSAPAGVAVDPGTVLVLADDGDLGHLGIDPPAAVVARGDGLTEDSPDRFRVAITDRAQLRQVLSTVTERHGPLMTVVCALPLSAAGAEPLARLTSATAELTAVLDVLDGGDFGAPRLLVLTSGAVYARPADRVDLGTCALTGLIRTAAGEATNVSLRQVDLPANRADWAAAIRADLTDPDTTGIVAARDGRRWRSRLVPISEEEPNAAASSLVPGGLYLVTGGLGGIAHQIAGYIAVDYGVKLLLVGRSPVAGPHAERLAELAEIGEVAYSRVDITDAEGLEAAVAAAEARWGRRLDGVLHLAGADPTRQWADLDQHLIVKESMDTFAEHYRSKVAGTLAIAKVLEPRPDASLLLFGSVNGEFGGSSFGAYAAANSFLTGFADHWHHERGRPVRCVAWSMWTEIGMNRSQPTAAAMNRGFRPIDPATGLRLFVTIMAMPYHYLLAGLDLANPSIIDEVAADRVEVSELVVLYTVDDAERVVVDEALAARVRDCSVPVRLVELPRIPRNAGGEVDVARVLLDAAPGKPKRAFVAPATELERSLANIWSTALNQPQISRDDSFFELGGNSLYATRLLALVDHDLGIRITTQELYENPTVAGMAAAAARAGVDTSD